MELIIVNQAKREIRNVPKDILKNLRSLIEDLLMGKHLSLPFSRPLFSIYRGLHELRFSSKAGEYRVFYIIQPGVAVIILYASSKKSQKIDKRMLNVIKARIRSQNL